MDRGGLLFKDVRLRRREAMGNKRLGGLLLRQTIHSGCKQRRRLSLLNGRVKTGNECGRGRDDLQACIALLYVTLLYCTITSCLTDGEIREAALLQPAQSPSAAPLKGSLLFNRARPSK